MTFEVCPCPEPLRAEALRVLYWRDSRKRRERLVVQALREAADGRLDLSGLWIARVVGQVVGAMMTQRLSRTSAAVWPPEVVLGWLLRDVVATRLVRGAMETWRGTDVRVVQALLDEGSQAASRSVLRRGGLKHVTDLVYLTRPILPEDASTTGSRLVWEDLTSTGETPFREVLEATFVGSLDMPELSAVRAQSDALETFRASCGGDTSLWRLGRCSGEPKAAAVIILNDQPDRDAVEVRYLGLTPAARGRGLGREAMDFALRLAATRRERVELAVDVRNELALRLYRATGFEEFDRRAVFLALL